ncbi:hypothetical protein Tco_0848558 [Tanacetum coccineum]
MKGRAVTTLEDLSQRVTDLATTLAWDTHEMRYHLYTAMLLESEARYTRQAWSQVMDCNRVVHAEILAYRAEVRALHEQFGVLQRQRTEDQRARKPEPARDLEPQDGPADAGSSSQGVATALAEYEAHRSSGNGDDSYESGSGKRTERAACKCTYSDFLKCQPLNFKGTEGVGNALTWWNSHIRTVGHEVAYGMTWKTLKKMMTDKMFLEESEEVQNYVDDLPDMIHGSVMASKPKTMQDAIEFATELMDQKIRTFIDRLAENKRKLDDNS